MKRTVRVAMAALLLTPVAVTAITSTPAGAAPAPTLSTTSGGPGTAIEVTSPDCPTEVVDREPTTLLQARLYVGTAPGETLAGVGTSGFGENSDGVATIIVPDWIDPALPAAVEAICVTVDPETFDVVEVEVELDPAPFDVLPGVGAPQQTRAYSRTSLLAGQAFEVSLAGCTLPDAVFAGVEVFRGDDRSARSAETVTSGDNEITNGATDIVVALTNAYTSYWMSSTGEGGGSEAVEDFGGDESPTDIAAGPVTAFTYCANDSTLLFYEPQLLQVTGSAPTAALDLTVAPGSRTATLAGTDCTAGDVKVLLEAVDAEDLFGDLDDDELDDTMRHGPFPRLGTGPDDDYTRRSTPPARGRSARDLGDDGYLETTVTPVAGAWTTSDDVAHDRGLVSGYATCGDPLADGFLYDPQVAKVAIQAPAPTTPPTVPTPAAPAPAPARAITGRPTYAG